MNTIYLMGRLGKDPELTYTQSKKDANETIVTGKTTLAVTRYNGKGKEKTTDWFDLVCFGRTADLLGEHFRKGHGIMVIGSMKLEMWETDAGEKRRSWRCIVDKIEFPPSKPGEGERRELSQEEIEKAGSEGDYECPF